MSRFPAEWLNLREPYDIAARNPVVLEAVRKAFCDRSGICVLDLACGTGSTLRALSAVLPRCQQWHLVDHDANHLSQAAALACPPHRMITTKKMNLAHQLDCALDGSMQFVTTSALLDLVSSEWLDMLITALAARRLPFYAALTYDGCTVVEPADALDFELLACFNRHQRSDKGFGPALGPAASNALAQGFEQRGYACLQGRSDWVLGTDDVAIQEAVFQDWATAGDGKLASAEVQAWLARRRAHLVQRRSSLRVGHVDCFAFPIGMR